MAVKLTDTQFKAFVKKNSPDFKVLGHYVNAQTPIKVQCIHCGNITYPSANALRRGKKCQNCIKQKKFKQKAAKASPGLKVITPYKGAQKLVTVECKKCHRQWQILACIITKGTRCYHCYPQKRQKAVTPESVCLKRIYKNNKNVKVISKYKGSKELITLECLICHTQWQVQAKQAEEGKTSCPHCRKQQVKNNFLQKAKEASPKLQVISNYKNADSPVTVQCPKCKRQWQLMPAALEKGTRCYHCYPDRHYGKRLSQQEFEEKAAEANPGIEIVGKYTLYTNYITAKCKAHGHIFKATARDILKGMQCPICVNNKRKQQMQNKLVKAINMLLPGTKIIKGHYENAKSKITVKCPKGHIRTVPASSLLKGYGCNICAAITRGRKEALSQSEFKQRVHKQNPTITVNEKQYQSRRSEIDCYCKKCHWHWTTEAGALLDGTGCPNCAHVRKYTNAEFQAMAKKENPDVIVISKYKGMEQKVKCQCVHCGNQWWQYASDVVHQHRTCPVCANKRTARKLTQPQKTFEKKLHKLFPKLQVLHYTKSHAPVTVKCLDCSHKWTAYSARELLHSQGCPICSGTMSKGEQAVLAYLEQHNYSYIYQFKIAECKDKRPLPFDFAVFNKDGSLNSLIEYQGIQHFYTKQDVLSQHKTTFYKSIPELEAARRRDKIKYNYCKKHHIKLIYINHYEGQPYDMPYIKKQVADVLDAQLHIA